MAILNLHDLSFCSPFKISGVVLALSIKLASFCLHICFESFKRKRLISYMSILIYSSCHIMLYIVVESISIFYRQLHSIVKKKYIYIL